MLKALNRLLDKTALPPEQISRVTDAYKLALGEHGLKDRDDPLTAIVAEKIMEIGQTGVQESAEICRLAIMGVGESPIKSRSGSSAA
jgi:hypothetical protein